MTTSPNAVISRPILGFTFEGLSDRDETLFKAIVRLLDHRTLQRWVYRPASPDLWVVADAVSSPTAPSEVDAAPPLVLTLSVQPARREHCLGLPLRADELEAELNSLGGARLGERGAGTTTTATTATTTPVTPGETRDAPMRLLRWPAPELLGTPERLRLATLMVKKPCTLAWLQQRSQVAPIACARFFAELQAAGLLAEADEGGAAAGATVAGGGSATPTPTRSTGLLARIRHRLDQFVRPQQP